MMPGPPAFGDDSHASARRHGLRREHHRGLSNISSVVSTRNSRPLCRSSASTATSVPASAPVCEAAARDPACVRPLFTTMIGFAAPDPTRNLR